MSLLRTSKLSRTRKTLLLIAACLLLAVPCVAAASFALHLDIDHPQPVISQQQESSQREAAQKLERAGDELQRAREELQRKGREIQERMRKNPNQQSAELEELHRMERELEQAGARLSHEQEAQHSRAAEERLRQLNESLVQIITTHPVDEARIREAQEKLEQLQRSLPENQERSRELREQLAMTEKQHLDTKLKAEHEQSLRRAQEEMRQQKEALSQEQREKIEEKLKLNRQQLKEGEQKYREARNKWEAEQREGKIKIKSKEYEKLIRKDVDEQVRKELEKAYPEGRAKKDQVELTQLATISMDRAIQIAISQHPGKVLSCNLGRQKDGQVFYRLVIITGDGDKSSATHVWVSATDGRILKTENE